jgi:hypothetical protein
MYTLCWSPKGGSGTTLVTAVLAVLAARLQPTVVIDLGGDIAPTLGADVAVAPGAGDWLCTSGAPVERLWQLAHRCGPTDGPDLRVVPQGAMPAGDRLVDLAAERIAAAAATYDGLVIVDAGRIVPHGPLVACAARSLMVVRPCFLALRRASVLDLTGSGIVLIDEPGRSLGRHDIEHALGVPVAAELPWDPAIARAVDAGLLRSRVPLPAARALGGLLP